ncbi:MAG: hypothetical protein AB7Q29_06570 [Vicinamibacterales bacterium]
MIRRPRASRALAVAVCLAVLMSAEYAHAQGPPGRVDVAGGVRMIGGIPFASIASEQTTREGTRALFQTATSLERSFGPIATVGVRFAGIFRIEGTFGYNNARLVTRITADQEEADDAEANAPVRQFLFEGGVAVEARRWQAGPLVPFASGGLGYLRQLYDGRTLVETGHSSYVGGGVLLERVPSARGFVKATGLRVDVRATRVRDGVISDGASHWAPALMAQVFARF